MRIIEAVKSMGKDTKELMKDNYFLLGKKKFSEEDYIKIKERVKEPYIKRVLKSYATCFLATFYLIGQVLGLFAGGLLLLIFSLILIIFIFITNPFLHLLYWYWYRKAIKQREQRLSSKGENNFNQESVTDNLQ